jgi:hypothetical protein
VWSGHSCPLAFDLEFLRQAQNQDQQQDQNQAGRSARFHTSKSLVVGGSWVARVGLKRCLAREKWIQPHWKPELQAAKAARNGRTKNSKTLENLTWQIWRSWKNQS